MAKQVGAYRFVGNVDGLCFYKMEGNYYVRKQSSLTGKRFWKALCFEATRQSCQRLARGSQLAAIVYKNFRKQKGLYAVLKTKAIALLKKKKSEDKVLRMLIKLASLLQPAKKGTTYHIIAKAGQKKKAKALASLFYIPSVKERTASFNLYLSSA